MKVSLVTATYNSINTLPDCVNSVLRQNYRDLEYVIIDGGSNDGTVEYIEEISKKHSNVIWVSEKDKGIYDALNKGIEMSTGKVVGFVHSDDFLAHENILTEVMIEFKAGEVDGVYGDLHYVDFTDTSRIVRNWTSQEFSKKLLYRGWMPAHPTLFLKKRVYKNFGNFNITFKIAADYDFILRIFRQPDLNFRYLPKTIMKMRVGGKSNKSLANLITKTREDLRAAKSNGFRIPLLVVGCKNLSKIPQWLKK